MAIQGTGNVKSNMNWGNSVGIETIYGLDYQSLILVADSFTGVKWPKLEAVHSCPFGTKIKNAWSYFCCSHVSPLLKLVLRL